MFVMLEVVALSVCGLVGTFHMGSKSAGKLHLVYSDHSQMSPLQTYVCVHTCMLRSMHVHLQVCMYVW